MPRTAPQCARLGQQMASLFETLTGPWGVLALGAAGGYFVRSFDPVARAKAAWATLTKPKG